MPSAPVLTLALTRWTRSLAALAIAALPAAAAADPSFSVVGSAHDLSASGGAVRGNAGQAQDQVCIYCHVPHNALRFAPSANHAGQGALNRSLRGAAAAFAASGSAPLWNRTNSTEQFTMYSVKNSSTFELANGDTNDPSRRVGPVSLACLSCHDGQTAFNSLNQTPMIDAENDISASAYTFKGAGGATVTNMAQASPAGAGSANLGRDLMNDHPVSFTYNTALATLKGPTLRDPAGSSPMSGGGDLVLYRAGGAAGGGASTIASQMLFNRSGVSTPDQLECTSCHEPHLQGNPADPNSNYPFLIKSNQRSHLCLTCHNK